MVECFRYDGMGVGGVVDANAFEVVLYDYHVVADKVIGFCDDLFGVVFDAVPDGHEWFFGLLGGHGAVVGYGMEQAVESDGVPGQNDDDIGGAGVAYSKSFDKSDSVARVLCKTTIDIVLCLERGKNSGQEEEEYEVFFHGLNYFDVMLYLIEEEGCVAFIGRAAEGFVFDVVDGE